MLAKAVVKVILLTVVSLRLYVDVFEDIIHMIGRVQAPGDPVLTLLQDWEETFQVQKRLAGGFLWI